MDLTHAKNILGVSEDTTQDNVIKRYRDLIKKYHPDKVANLGIDIKKVSSKKTKEINEAYRVIKKHYSWADRTKTKIGVTKAKSYNKRRSLKRKTPTDKVKNVHLFESWAFSKTNYVIGVLGLLTIISAYVIMDSGTVNSFQSLTLAPIMLFIGYLIIIPIALIYRDKKKQ